MEASTTTDHDIPGILRMPLELLQLVTRHLTTPDYGHLRQTCKHLDAALYGGFTKEFFRKKQFMLSPFSLQALIDISNSRLANGLQHVIIGTERPLETDRYVSSLGFGAHSPLQRNSFVRHLEDHLALLSCGYDIQMMSEAFAKLANLEIVEIRDFASSRPRDGTTWKSYGFATFQTETGLTVSRRALVHHPNVDQDYSTRLFQNILRALGKANVRPKRLEVNTRHSTSGLVDRAFKVQKFDESQVIPVLAGLEAIHLDFSHSELTTLVASQEGPGDLPCALFHLRKFLSLLHSLRTLRLNFQAMNSDTETHLFLDWFQSPLPLDMPTSPIQHDPGSLPQAPPPVLLEKLEQLEIGKVAVRLDTLVGIFEKYKKTLKNVQLHRVGIKDPNPLESKTNQWAIFFRRMAQLDLNINSLTMSHLYQSRQGFPTSLALEFKDTKPSHTRKWRGHDLRGALKDFVQHAQVDWPPEPQSDDDDDGSENSMEDSMDEYDDVDDT
ncbi:hypothetical protein PFICI_01170 [Pestalotiopsis fici W106-1]|uniref:F-box domain-containing protein n=1 Tax=Pestalotiopsis fici (strain W106-1 / CGMCC3.15140) TaxID=1229662 RepID=W3XPA2_PESFW|nr:uncharacterized protein PFICI_01170 [Pestalotiopsis fici W106-1]ETS87342.1 hypothetical protein PFICI_01170 [Pestalotiopsis fici W106-1]